MGVFLGWLVVQLLITWGAQAWFTLPSLEVPAALLGAEALWDRGRVTPTPTITQCWPLWQGRARFPGLLNGDTVRATPLRLQLGSRIKPQVHRAPGRCCHHASGASAEVGWY